MMTDQQDNLQCLSFGEGAREHDEHRKRLHLYIIYTTVIYCKNDEHTLESR